MRLVHIALLSAGATLLGSAYLKAEQSIDLPLRKAGLWEVHTETDEGGGTHKQDLTMCIGAEMERDTVRASGAENRANCSKYEIKKVADETTVDAVCAFDDRQVTTRTELSGDFTSAFKVKVDSTTSGHAPRSQGGQPVNAHRIILQEGTYLGDGCKDLKAGEAKGADGHAMTVQ